MLRLVLVMLKVLGIGKAFSFCSPCSFIFRFTRLCSIQPHVGGLTCLPRKLVKLICSGINPFIVELNPFVVELNPFVMPRKDRGRGQIELGEITQLFSEARFVMDKCLLIGHKNAFDIQILSGREGTLAR